MDQVLGPQVTNLEDSTDAGLKMASANSESLASATHELKIMDVEGGAVVEVDPVEETAPLVILVDDDDGDAEMEVEEEERPEQPPEDGGSEDIMDYDHAPLVAELQSALNNPDDKATTEDPLLEDPDREPDTMSTKTEPSSDGESNHSYHDPMGLLEPIDNQDGGDSQDDDDDFSVDESSTGGNNGSIRKRMPRAQRWLIWMKRWPWILHEPSDGTFAFCLYCNMNINVNNRAKHIQNHNMSLYHQERECNYLAFKKSEEQTRGTTSDNEVKHEFGTKSYVAAMKQKRVTEIEAFNNFNWLRWLRWHPWLERAQPTGTTGLCRVCNVRMNVEFVYLRKRHETTKGHLEALRQLESDKPSRKRKRSKSTNDAAAIERDIDLEKESEPEGETEDAQETTVVMMNGEMNSNEDPSRWCELIPDTNPQQCRCTLCDTPMAITSFIRHCKGNAHCHKLKTPQEKGSSDDRGIWAVFADVHPWLTADPDDPSIAYCSICRKRFMYGNSEIKRKNHEKSEKHTSAVAAAKAALDAGLDEKRDGDNDDAEEEEGVQISEGAQSERSDSERTEDLDDDNWSETQEAGKGSAAKVGVEPRKAKIRAGMRFYPWLCYSKDRKTQMCKFCRVRFHNETAKARHEFSARHAKLMKQYKVHQLKQPPATQTGTNQQDEQEEEDTDAQSNTDSGTVTKKPARPASKLFVKPIPATMKGKVMVWKGRFPWLSYKKSEQRGNYAWCKLCEVSLYLPSSKWASKHQRTSRHIRLRIDRKRNGGPSADIARSRVEIPAVVATASALASGEARMKAAMAELQAKYDWLDPDSTDENHCHCRVCDTRLPIKVFYLRQHDASRKHADNMERHRNSVATNANAPSVSNASTAEAERQESGLDKESDGDLSVRSDNSTAEPPTKRSRRSMEVRRILRALRDSVTKRQDERSQMDMAKDMICSSFDIVSRLRTLEREAAAHNETAAQAPPPMAQTKSPEPRHVLDLFFDSIAPTMKSLPPDLAAEGKAKIMQLVCGLEVRAMQRNSPPNTGSSTTTSVAPSAPSVPAASIPADVDVHSNVITIQDDEQALQNNNNEVESVQTKPASAGPTTQVTINGNQKDLPNNLRRILSSSQVKVTSHYDTDSVRCVPLDKLTTTSRINGNVRLSQSGSSEAPTTPQADLSNGNTLAMLRQIRVNNSNTSKMITITKSPMQQQQQHQQTGNVTSTPIMRGGQNSNGTQMTTFRALLSNNRRP
ncbi:protein suppressor of variegation 3-7 [Drosophila ficusphila]|uniref:protein suppressor of variegation 3-7 n=1 Tax=Drosophila ficusphila TaxID=30025 RepID=UPI0007E8987C|nr:protein suppressor of variegation 3-7 [Drosophila ficusphila]